MNNDNNNQQQLAPANFGMQMPMGLPGMTPAMMESVTKQMVYQLRRTQQALMRPRDPVEVEKRLLSLCKTPEFAQVAMYEKPTGGKKIKGLSARFAEAAMPVMRNLSEATTQVYDDGERQTWSVAVEDLETNVVFSEEVFVNKRVWRRSQKDNQEYLDRRQNTDGVWIYLYEATDDEVNTLRAALCSKVRRNLINRHIPPETRQACIDQCNRTRTDADAKDPDAARKKIVGSFLDIGITSEDLAAYLGHSIRAITDAELEELRSVFVVIRDGDTTWPDLLAEKQEERAQLKKNGGLEKVKTKVRERRQREERVSAQQKSQQQTTTPAEKKDAPKDGATGTPPPEQESQPRRATRRRAREETADAGTAEAKVEPKKEDVDQQQQTDGDDAKTSDTTSTSSE